MNDASQGRAARKFVIDTAVVAVSQLVIKLRQIVALPLIVKLLGIVMYGVWSQTTSFTLLLGAAVSGNLHVPLVRLVAADPAAGRRTYSTLLAATLVLSGMGALVAWIFAAPIGKVLVDELDMSPYLRLGVIAMVLSNVRILNLNVYRATGRLLARSVYELISSLGELAGIVWLLVAGYDLLDVLFFVAVWHGALAIVQTTDAFRILGMGAPNLRVLSEALRYSLPLLPASLSIWALDRADRFVIGMFEGAHGVGVYSANYAVAGLLMLAQAPFQITLLPKVAELWDRDRETAGRYISVSNKIFLTLAVPFIACMPMVARPILELLGNREIAEASGVTTFLIAGGVGFWGVSIMQTQIFYGAKRPGVVGAVTGAAALLNLGLNFVLVPALGVAGAALATLLAYATTCGALAWLSRSVLVLEFDPPYLIRVAASAAAAAIFLAVAGPRSPWALAFAIAGAALVYFGLLRLLRPLLPGRLAAGLRDLTGPKHGRPG